jgi:hypothetical protein
MIACFAGSAVGAEVGADVDESVLVVGELVAPELDELGAEVVGRRVVVVPSTTSSSPPHDDPRQSSSAAAIAAATSGDLARGVGCGSPVEDTAGLLKREDPCPTTAEHPAMSLVIAAAAERNRGAFSRDGWSAS